MSYITFCIIFWVHLLWNQLIFNGTYMKFVIIFLLFISLHVHIQAQPNLSLIDLKLIQIHQRTCMICLEDFNDSSQILATGCLQEKEHLDVKCSQIINDHCFHQLCLSTWLNEHNSCPLCRRKISDLNQSSICYHQYLGIACIFISSLFLSFYI